MVSRPKTFRRDNRDRLLPPRKPQPHPHRRAKAFGRKPELAALLVRPIPERKCCCLTAGCEVKASEHPKSRRLVSSYRLESVVTCNTTRFRDKPRWPKD